MIKRALLSGMTSVDPDTHQGWPGTCPGADVDLRKMTNLCKFAGVDVASHYNQQCTKQAFFDGIIETTKHMVPNDLLVIFNSGHGSYVKDPHGDESDGKDEIMVMWDTNITDDEFWNVLCEIPKDVRVLCIFDQCHSETFARFVAPAPRPLEDLKAQVIVFAGCADANYSYGNALGGELTEKVVSTWIPTCNYKEWFNAIYLRMPNSQKPKYTEYGDPTGLLKFRNTEAMA